MSSLALTNYQRHLFSLIDVRVQEGEERKDFKKNEKLSQLIRVQLWGHLWRQEPLKLSDRQIQFLQKAQGIFEWHNTPYLSVFKLIHLSLSTLLGSDHLFRPKMRVPKAFSHHIGPIHKNMASIRFKLYDAVAELSMFAEGFQFLTDKPLEEHKVYPKCLELLNKVENSFASFSQGFEFFSAEKVFSPILDHLALLKMAFSPNPQKAALDYDLAPFLLSPADNFLQIKKPNPVFFPALFFNKKDACILNGLWEFFSFAIKNTREGLAPLAHSLEQPEFKQELLSLIDEIEAFASDFSKARFFNSLLQRYPFVAQNDSFLDQQFLDALESQNLQHQKEIVEFTEIKKGFRALNGRIMQFYKKVLHEDGGQASKEKKQRLKSPKADEQPSLTFVTKDDPVLKQNPTITFTKHQDCILVEIEQFDENTNCKDFLQAFQNSQRLFSDDPSKEKFVSLLQLCMYLEYSFLQADKFGKLTIEASTKKMERVLAFFKDLLRRNALKSYYLYFFDIVVPFETGIYFQTENEMEIFSLSVAYYYRNQADALDSRFQELICAQPKTQNTALDPLHFLKDPVSLNHPPQYFDPQLVGQLKSYTSSDSHINLEVARYFQDRAKMFLDLIAKAPLFKEEKKNIFKLFDITNSDLDWTIEDLLVYAKKISKKVNEAQEFLLTQYSVSSAPFFIHSLIAYFFTPFYRIQIEHDLTQEPAEKKRSGKKKGSPKTPPLGALIPFEEQKENLAVESGTSIDASCAVEQKAPIHSNLIESTYLENLKSLMKELHLEMEPNFRLVCEMLEKKELTYLGRSFYREFFSSVRGWIERMLKVYDPDNKSHQLYDLYINLPAPLFVKHGNLVLDKKECHLLTILSRLYIFHWDLEEPLVESTFCPLFRELLGEAEEKQVFKELFFSSMQLATKILLFVSRQNSCPPVQFVLPKVVREKAVPTLYLLGAVEKLNEKIKEYPLEDHELEEVSSTESFSHKFIRLSKIHAIPKKIEYHLEGLAPLIFDWTHKKTISYPLAHHILYRLSMLLESAIDLSLYSCSATDHTGMQHVIFESFNGRPLGFSHDTLGKFTFLPDEIQELFLKEEVPFFREFANFSNSVCFYQDWSSGPLKSYLDTLQSISGLENILQLEDLKQQLLTTKKQVLMIVCRFLSQHLEKRKIKFERLPILDRAPNETFNWRSRIASNL